MEKSKNLKEVVIKIDGKEWQDALDKAFKKINKDKTISGFRKGKAPKNVYLKHYGVESLFYEASNICCEDAYKKMIEENKNLKIAAQPILDIKSIDKDYIEYVFTLTLMPEVTLGKYKKLDVKKEDIEVTKEEVEHEIKHMQEDYKEIIIKEGKIEDGDIAVIDFEGFKDGVAFDGGKGENYSLTIGSNTFIPGFEDQLIGLSAGDEKDIELSFPKDYHVEDLKGQPVVFKVKVHEVKQIKLPELDKDFFEDLGMDGIDSKESLEQQVRENILARKDQQAEDRYIDALLSAIRKDTQIDVPETMIDEEIHNMVHHFEEHLLMQGLNLDQFYKMTGTNEDRLKAEYHDEAVKRIENRLIIDKIIKEEKIEVSDEEVEERLEELAKKYNVTKKEVKKEYGNDLDYISYDLKVKKVFDIIKETNQKKLVNYY